MKIAVVSAFYSEGMGYTENCLPRALAKLGHDVHVVTTVFNVYGNDPGYKNTYEGFLGPSRVSPGTKRVDGYTVHRLEASAVQGYVRFHGLSAAVRRLAPDIVHSLEVASLQTYELAALKPFRRFRLFCESHQHMSVVRPFLKQPGSLLRKAGYRLTRTWPTRLASLAVETCYAIAPDCLEVAHRFYGVPHAKLKLMSLGADTETFHPAETIEDSAARQALRATLGVSGDDVLCVYTGRFSQDKNPLVLARAIEILADTEPRFKALFIGDGQQKTEIAACRHTTVVPFMTHANLAAHYRAADIGVWPREESMSMIDAAASGLPLIVSNRIGEPSRVDGNGRTYDENDPAALADVIRSFGAADDRRHYGSIGRQKIVGGFTWQAFARTLEADFLASLRV
jgi:glycosyltransferase involved in cell wall biosynthesis